MQHCLLSGLVAGGAAPEAGLATLRPVLDQSQVSSVDVGSLCRLVVLIYVLRYH